MDFGPPLGQTNYNTKRKQLEEFVYDHSFRAGSPSIPSNNYAHDYYDEEYGDDYEEYDVEDSYFDQYPYNEKKRQKSRNDAKKTNDERNLIVNKSPSSGQITVVVLPSEPDDKKIKPHPNSEAIINELRGIQSNNRRRKNENERIDDQFEDNLGNHKFGKDYEIEIFEDDDVKQLSEKEKRLQDLIDFVNGGEVPKNYEKKKIINLGVKNSLSDNKDMNKLFDDVIETTPSSLGGDIEWGKKMWKEVKEEFKDDTIINDRRRRQKIRVRKQKEPSKNISPSTERPRRKVVDDANILSIWAAAEKVKENGPSLRFDSSEEESRESKEMSRKEDSDDIYKKYKPSPTPATKQFYRENFNGFNLKQETIERDFQVGFEPSALDVASRRGQSDVMTFSGSRRQNVLYNDPNIDNHASSGRDDGSYDRKMIIDLPPVTPSSLPPGVSRDVTRDRLRDGGPVMTQHHPFYHHQMNPSRTKTLQKLTLGN